MTLYEYANLVADMRHKQTDYFRHRESQPRLAAARAAEARVDKATREIIEGQRVMFPGPDEAGPDEDRGPPRPAA